MSGLVSGTSYQIVIVTTSGDEQSDAATWNITTSSIRAASFTQCPEGEVLSFNVPPDSDTVQIDVDIEAVDGNGNTINHDIIGGNIDIPGTLQFSETSKNGIVVNVRAVDDNHEIWCQFTVKVLDPHPPIITLCPSDQSQLTSHDSVLVEWDDAVATDNTELLSVTTDRVSGSVFPVGTSTVTVTAMDTSGNTATCTFVITITHGLEKCSDLQVPWYGALSCAATETAFQCVLNCKERYQPFRGRDVYTCISKIWNPTQPPRCVRLAPGHDVGLAAEFTYPGVCESFTDMQKIIDNFHARIDDHDLCTRGENRVCNENSFIFTCGKDSKRRKRQADDLVVTVEVKLSNTANNSELEEESFFDILDTMQKDLNETMKSIEYLVKNGSFSLEINNQTILCDPNSFRIGEPVWTCFKGYVSTSVGCVACPVGSYYDPSITDCIFCPVNEFQKEEAQLECEQCKDGKYTKGIGSFRESHCFTLASPNFNNLIVIVVFTVIVVLIIIAVVIMVVVTLRKKRRAKNRRDEVAYSCRNQGYYDEMDEGKLKRDNTKKLGKAMYDGEVEDIAPTALGVKSSDDELVQVNNENLNEDIEFKGIDLASVNTFMESKQTAEEIV
ncbi:sushi, von Willebrand factor type A, EGF and pentraxin domain-containing protein 1-like [Glandiceps talaboti]